MSILEQYGKLPSVEDMMDALASPIVPQSASTEVEMELSTDEMIKAMFLMMKQDAQEDANEMNSMGMGMGYDIS